MSMNRWKVIATPVVMVGLFSPFLINCEGMPKIPGVPTCPEMDSGDFAHLKISGGAQIEGKVKAFLNATADLKKLSEEVEADLVLSCGKLGKDIGVKDEELKKENGAEKICGAVAAKIQADLKASGSAKLSLDIGTPKCSADVEVMQKCFAGCGSPVKGGDLKASCQGGEISGKCDAECKGKCTVEAGASCSGTCSASCSGSCDAGFSGTCGGKCDGKCDSKDSKGKPCAGKCEGKCDAKAEGSCSGTCGGKCSGSCEAKAGAKCEGTCSGGCSAEIKAPKCSGEFKPPSVSVDCQMSCGLKGILSAKCEPPPVKVKVEGKGGADIEKLVAALEADLPAIAKIQLGLASKASGAVVGVAKAGADLKSGAMSAGLEAGACIVAGIAATAKASVNIKANVSVSANVSTSASGKASGGT